MNNISKAVQIGSVLVLVSGALFLRATTASAGDDEKVLLKGTLHTHTNDDDKDHDTCVFATVKSADGSSLIAHIDNGDCSPSDGSQYKDDSDHDIALVVDGAGSVFSDDRGFKVHVWQRTHGGRGHDKWKFDARVTLEFSGHKLLVAEKSGITLESKGENEAPSVDFENK